MECMVVVVDRRNGDELWCFFWYGHALDPDKERNDDCRGYVLILFYSNVAAFIMYSSPFIHLPVIRQSSL